MRVDVAAFGKEAGVGHVKVLDVLAGRCLVLLLFLQRGDLGLGEEQPRGGHRLLQSVQTLLPAGAGDVAQLLGQIQQPHLGSDDPFVRMRQEGYLWF